MEGEGNPTVEILPAGATLGSYTIEELLGAGASTLVYRAVDGRLGRDVALKVLAAGTVTRGLQDRFIEEARAAASLGHPNIAVIYEVGDCGGACYIAMEYVDGETLRQRFRAPDRPLSGLLGYLLQAAGAMAKAHTKRIVHCDLKPDNIMVTREGLVKVLDFGLARLIARYSGAGERGPRAETPRRELVRPLEPRVIEGTLGYMSPEQAEGRKDLDERSDIFSFGCILFEAATGRLPFTGNTAAETLRKLRDEPAPPLRALCPDAPPGLDRIVGRCLEKDPGRRYSSMEEVESALRELLRTPAARPTGMTSRRKWVVAGAALVLAAVAGTLEYARRRAPAKVQSVAVIPFATAHGGPETGYLADGISEGLINALAQAPGLKVIARSSSFRFRGQRIDAPQAARALGAQALVLLSVAGSGERLRVTVDLVAPDGTQIWGAQYNSGTSGLAGLEAGISNEIARRIGATLSEMERKRLAKTAQVKPEAYELLLRGRYYLRLYTPENLKKAAGYYEQALAVDPGFALAHAELASLYRFMSGSALQNPSEAMPRAEAEARRALAADHDLAEAHAAVADIRKDQWDWATAESEYRQALRLNPNLVTAHLGYAIFLGVRGNHEAAIGEARRALELDPLGALTAVHAGAAYYNARRFPEAIRVFSRAAELDPSAPPPWSWIGIVHGATGRHDEAVKAMEKAVSLGDGSAATQCYYSFSLAQAGRRKEALQVLDRLRHFPGFVPPSAMAIVHLGLNQKDEAIRALQTAYDVRDPLLQYLKLDPRFDVLANQPFLRDLLAKIGLPE